MPLRTLKEPGRIIENQELELQHQVLHTRLKQVNYVYIFPKRSQLLAEVCMDLMKSVKLYGFLETMCSNRRFCINNLILGVNHVWKEMVENQRRVKSCNISGELMYWCLSIDSLSKIGENAVNIDET